MHSNWINKFLVTVHNSAYLKRPGPSTLLWVGNARLVADPLPKKQIGSEVKGYGQASHAQEVANYVHGPGKVTHGYSISLHLKRSMGDC